MYQMLMLAKLWAFVFVFVFVFLTSQVRQEKTNKRHSISIVDFKRAMRSHSFYSQICTQQKHIPMFTNTCTGMFTALFIMAQTGNYPKGPLPVEWVNRLWSSHTMEQYEEQQSITMCNNMNDSHNVKQKQPQQSTYYMILLIFVKTKKGKTHVCHMKSE